jgi:hypothetical protein
LTNWIRFTASDTDTDIIPILMRDISKIASHLLPPLV